MCESCQVIRINGVACHETGCRNSWIDPDTGIGYPAPCWECGCDFIPENRPSKYSLCQDCLNPQPIPDEFDIDDEDCDGAWAEYEHANR